MGTTDNGPATALETTTGFLANRRDVLRTATGLAAAAIVGGTLLDRNQVAVAAGADGSIVGNIAGLGEFSVLAFSWGVSNSGSQHTGGGGGAGKASFQDVSLTKLTDALTPQLLVAVASGKHFKDASLTYGDKKGNPILRLDLRDLIVTSLSMGGSSGDELMSENLTLNFGRVVLSVGDATGGWNIIENKGV